jgi:hypothetical protein
VALTSCLQLRRKAARTARLFIALRYGRGDPAVVSREYSGPESVAMIRQ